MPTIDARSVEISVSEAASEAANTTTPEASLAARTHSGRMPLSVLVRKNRNRKVAWLAGILPV